MADIQLSDDYIEGQFKAYSEQSGLSEIPISGVEAMLDFMLKDKGSSGKKAASISLAQKLDTNGDGKIQFNEFENALAVVMGVPKDCVKYMGNIKAIFKEFDNDGDENIDLGSEFEKLCLHEGAEDLAETAMDTLKKDFGSDIVKLEDTKRVLQKLFPKSEDCDDYVDKQFKAYSEQSGLSEIPISGVEAMLDFMLKDKGSSGKQVASINLAQRLDTNGDGKIQFAEFENALAVVMGVPKDCVKYMGNIKAIFKEFDTDGDENIDLNKEFEKLCLHEGAEDLAETAMDTLKKEFDQDGSGIVYLSETKRVLHKVFDNLQ